MTNTINELYKHAPSHLHGQLELLEEVRRVLLEHPIYTAIKTEAQLRLFMERHVFAVWDFMSLVKKLQRRYTCCEVPWHSPCNPAAARLINQIVLDEESDLDKDGNPCSHLDLYLLAMKEVECNTMPFVNFVWALRNGDSLVDGLQKAAAPKYVVKFVKNTISIATIHPDESLVATFFFGREDPIPQMFHRIGFSEAMHSMAHENFTHYLNRHIHADAEEHGPAALSLLLSVLGTCATSWEVALQSAVRSIAARISFWDGILGEIAMTNESSTWDTPEISYAENKFSA